MEKYAEEIECDLQSFRNVDLLDFFRGVRPWAQYYRMVKHLPSEGKFKAAQAADPELAKAMAEQPERESPLPTLEGYSTEVRLQVAIFNMLKVLDWHLLRVNGNKAPAPQLWPIPSSALERELSYRKKLVVDKVLADLGVEK